MEYIFREGMFKKKINYIDDLGIHLGKELLSFDGIIGIKLKIYDDGNGKFTFALLDKIKKDLFFGADKQSLSHDAFHYLLEKTKLETEEAAFTIFQFEIDHPYRDENLLKQISESERESGAIAKCPKCGSPSLTTNYKRLSLARAVVGGTVFGVAGAAVGAITSKKTICICMKCGNKWKL